LYTSDTKEVSLRIAKFYLLAALFTAFFGGVYEIFSHEVYSFSMIYAFAYPLAGGVLPFLLLAQRGGKNFPGAAARQIYHAGIATLTVGSIMRGVLEIYGTTNSLVRWYTIAGLALVITGLAIYAVQALAGKKRRAGSALSKHAENKNRGNADGYAGGYTAE